DLVDAEGRDGQRAGGDVGGRRGSGVEGVVGGVGAADRDAADGDCLGRADVLVGEARQGVAAAEDVTYDPVVAQGGRGGGRAVVDLVHPGGSDVQRPGGDVGGRRGGGVEGVVRGVGAGDRDAAYGDRLRASSEGLREG